MQFLQQNLTGLHNPPLFIGSSFNGCNVTLGLSAAFIATFSPVIKTECLNCTASGLERIHSFKVFRLQQSRSKV